MTVNILRDFIPDDVWLLIKRQQQRDRFLDARKRLVIPRVVYSPANVFHVAYSESVDHYKWFDHNRIYYYFRNQRKYTYY